MRLVACALYILLVALTSFQTHAHDASALLDSETFIKGRIVEVNGGLLLHLRDGGAFRIRPDLQFLRNQNVSVSGYAEFDYFTVQSVISDPSTWPELGSGQGIYIQGRIVPRANGGLDFYPTQRRAVDLLGGQKSFPIVFPNDLHPPDDYIHEATVQGIIHDGKLVMPLDQNSLQIHLRRAHISPGDTISWTGTLAGGESPYDRDFTFGDSYSSDRPSFGFEMYLPTNFHVLDAITGQFVPAEHMVGGGFSASLGDGVNRVELLRQLRFTGKLETNHHFLIESFSGNTTVNVPSTLHGSHPNHLVPDFTIEKPVDRKGLQVISGDRQRVTTEERRCEVELRRSKIKVVK